ncbi:MAG TPA: SDR family NAD(P)-dependent oxidoreductase [Ktedonosporobacter sp.]|jgi:NAD(P)-dependent dehydrogenase (short-subunit alcohol dehydrogenase family)|nr:SDR family NAD(P)-dependent oxidoreductase [Ktedonosporobacter sp.]
MDLNLAGKHALVTGGSRGIGRAIALALAEQGVSVAACYHSESEDVRSLATELERYRNGSYVVQVDISSKESVARMAESVRQRFGKLNILVNNAGVISHIPLAAMEFDQWQQVIATNLTSLYLVTHATQSMLVEGGSIINVGSAVASVGIPARTHYTASKAGVVGFSRSLCKEMGPRGIRVNVIAPGVIDTHQAAGLSAQQRERYASMAALGRLGQGDDIAGVALFLASDLSRFVSGTTINVDGGI